MASISFKGNEELDLINERARALDKWFKSERFQGIERPYTAK